jgi:hypothetical protein
LHVHLETNSAPKVFWLSKQDNSHHLEHYISHPRQRLS